MSPDSSGAGRYGLARNNEWEPIARNIVPFLSEFADLLKKNKVSAKCRLISCDGFNPVIATIDSESLIFPFNLSIINEKKITAKRLHDLVVQCLTEVYQPENGIDTTRTGISFEYASGEKPEVIHRVDIAITYYDGNGTRMLRYDPQKKKYSFEVQEVSGFDLSEMNILKRFYKTPLQRIIPEFGMILCSEDGAIDDVPDAYDRAFRKIFNDMVEDPNFDLNRLSYPDDEPSEITY